MISYLPCKGMQRVATSSPSGLLFSHHGYSGVGGTWVYKRSLVVLRSCSPGRVPPLQPIHRLSSLLSTNTLLYHLIMQPFRHIQIQIVLALTLAASVIATPTPQSRTSSCVSVMCRVLLSFPQIIVLLPRPAICAPGSDRA